MKYYFLIFFSLINFIVLSQNTFYLDDNFKQIDSSFFKSKVDSQIYNSVIYRINDTIVYRLNKQYEFGKLNIEDHKQIIANLKKITNKKLSKKNIILIYNDSLQGYRDNYKLKYSEDNSLKYYLKERKKYDEKQKKCLTKFRKYDVEILNIYSYKKNFNFTPKYFKHYRVSNLIKNTFFKREMHGIIILKPNGDYFYYKYLTEEQLLSMLNSNWSKLVEDFNKKKYNPNQGSVNFISRMKQKHLKKREELGERHRNFKIEQALFRNSKRIQSRRITLPLIYGCYNYSTY